MSAFRGIHKEKPGWLMRKFDLVKLSLSKTIYNFPKSVIQYCVLIYRIQIQINSCLLVANNIRCSKTGLQNGQKALATEQNCPNLHNK